MSECMTQEDAMNMSNERAIEILKPTQKMLLDQYGCPISELYFAVEKAIEALNTLNEIENIINQPQIYEDVLKYKMICQLVRGEQE